MITPRLTTMARTALVQHQRRGFYSVTPGLPQVRVSLGVSILFPLTSSSLIRFKSINFSILMRCNQLPKTLTCFRRLRNILPIRVCLVLFFFRRRRSATALPSSVACWPTQPGWWPICANTDRAELSKLFTSPFVKDLVANIRQWKWNRGGHHPCVENNVRSARCIRLFVSSKVVS